MTRRERAVSVPVNYTLSIVIVTVLLSGLIMAMGDQLRSQQERTVDSEFGVLGNRMAADISATDRLVETTEDAPLVEVQTEIPQTVAGMSYQIEIESTPVGDTYEVTVTFVSSQMGITEEVHLKTETEVVDTRLSGGDYVIEYDPGADALEVKNA